MLYREYALNSGFQEEPLDMPAGAQVVNVDRSPENRIRLTVLLDETELQRQTRIFRCLTSGSKIPEAAGKNLIYLGSVNLLPLQWHVHEVVSVAAVAPETPTTAPQAPTEATTVEKTEASTEAAPAAEVTPEPAAKPTPEVTAEPTLEATPEAAPAPEPTPTNPFKTAK